MKNGLLKIGVSFIVISIFKEIIYHIDTYNPTSFLFGGLSFIICEIIYEKIDERRE